MPSRFFEPWVGCHYQEGINDKKILIMAHDHVCDGCERCGIVEEREECAFFTQNTVNNYINWRRNGIMPNPDYKGWLHTYLNFAKFYFGVETDIETEVKELWDKIIFYNYLQVSVPTYNSPAPSLAYVQAQKPFIELINEYEPDWIIAWGEGAYDYTPPYNGKNLAPLVFENAKSDRYQYTLESGKKCIMMNNTSSLNVFFIFQVA